MKERKLTVSIEKANVYGVVLTVAAFLLAGVLWYMIWGGIDIDNLFGETDATGDATNEDLWIAVKVLVAMVVFISGIVVHELVHGITWAMFAKRGWKSISFGMIWKMLTPYCHCDEPLKVREYIIGALMPLLVVGVIPMILGLCLQSIFLTFFGAFYVGGAAGDIMIVVLLRHEPAGNMVLDHPSEAGCLIYEE